MILETHQSMKARILVMTVVYQGFGRRLPYHQVTNFLNLGLRHDPDSYKRQQ